MALEAGYRMEMALEADWTRHNALDWLSHYVGILLSLNVVKDCPMGGSTYHAGDGKAGDVGRTMEMREYYYVKREVGEYWDTTRARVVGVYVLATLFVNEQRAFEVAESLNSENPTRTSWRVVPCIRP